MKKIMTVALVAVFSPLPAFADGCMDTATSQGRMNGCASKSYQEADKRLNAAYRNATAQASADATEKKS